MISFQDLSIGYVRGPQVLDGFSLAVPAGRILALLGPSGCGKTTLLKAAAGLVGPRTKSVLWSGTVDGRNPGATSMIFQDLGLLPWKTVEQNVALPLKWRRLSDWKPRTARLLAELGLSDHARAWPGTLSGGLAQRTALARALALRPELLLMDEPFSALDALTRERAQQILWELWAALGHTVILVTHSVDEAVALGHSVAVMTGLAPGRLAGVFDMDWTKEDPAQRRQKPLFFEWTKTLRAALEGKS